jgi:hypothetical protein
MEVRYVDTNHNLDALWFAGQNWNFVDLTTLGASPIITGSNPLPGTFDVAANSVEFYYFSPTEHVIQMFYNGSWHSQDLTLATGSQPSSFIGTLASAFNPILNSSDVYYSDNNGHIQRLSSVAAAPWSAQDLTSLTGAPPAIGGSTVAFYNPTANTMEVYYVAGTNTNERVIQLFFGANSGWHVQDLTVNTGAPGPGNFQIVGLHDPVRNLEEVYYQDASGHLRQLWSDGTGWFAKDLTVASGAPICGPGLISVVHDPIANNIEVYYATQQPHVEQLFSDSAGNWQPQDLTVATGGPSPIAGGGINSSIYDPIANSIEVYYAAPFSHVVQLWVGTGFVWHWQDLTAATNAPLVATTFFNQ